MNQSTIIAIVAVFIALLLSGTSHAANLLRNPGFEDPAGWSTAWTIRDKDGGNLTYHYRLTDQGGGHGDARPRSGENALEVYSTDRRTYLVQSVRLEPGTYRLSAWARLNGTPDACTVEFKIGDKTATVPLAASDYKPMWADFEIEKAGDYEVSVHPPFYGIALDDLSLEPVAETAGGWWPVFHIDLFPGSRDRGRGIQYCLKGTPQWVSFGVTCLAPKKMGKPVLRILASDPVVLSGLNEYLINHYRVDKEHEAKVTSERVTREGRAYNQFSFALPYFVGGLERPLSFGGLWVSDVPAKDGRVIFEIVEGDTVVGREELTLVPVDPPARHRAPKRYYTFSYAVQSWQMALPERIKALPEQFAMMGLNVWSDYGLAPEKPETTPGAEDQVRKAAYERGIRQFWPNFSSMLNTSGGGIYSDASDKVGDKDMYVVRRDGTVDKSNYNFNYCANKGRAWMESAVAAWPRMVKEPARLGLPFRYQGYVNDGLEGLHYSYDPPTLAAFAEFKGVDAGQVTFDRLDGEWHKDWLRFNMELYSRVVDIWAEAIHKVDPAAKIVNTASTYGPAGFDELTVKEQMEWARSVDYNMPQWYAQDYFGSAYSDSFASGEAEGVFDKDKGGVDLVPLLNLTMGGPLENPEAIRFKILDFASNSRSFAGVGYYIGTYGFCDASFMVGLSEAHTLFADVEDYYADGARDDALVKLVPASGDRALVPGMDLQGNQTMVKPNASTVARVHRLGRDGRIALITVVTYSEQKVGDAGSIEIDVRKLPNQGKGLYVIDRLTGRKTPFTSTLEIDTSKTGNVALFEITSL